VPLASIWPAEVAYAGYRNVSEALKSSLNLRERQVSPYENAAHDFRTKGLRFCSLEGRALNALDDGTALAVGCLTQLTADRRTFAMWNLFN
jgi:hypothetical protein